MDPNEQAIAWAQEHLPGIQFAVSPQEPPLDYPDGHFDFVVAISIWSHYGERAAIRWLEEMRRIIRPGGYLVFSTHGLQSVAFYAQIGHRAPAQLAQIRRDLYRHGYWYLPEFGEAGDWGVKHDEWGTAFFTPEWLARVATPAVDDRGLRRRPERRQPGHVRPAPPLTGQVNGTPRTTSTQSTGRPHASR